MRILLLSHAFNSLTQRLWLELEADGHALTLEYDINDAVTRQAVALAQPDVIVAPFLKRAIPEDVWRCTPCFIVHPGPLGDKGASSLDHAVQKKRSRWGVTVLQAGGEMDAGPVWATEEFAMRDAPKSSLYRAEVTEAAVKTVRAALERKASGQGPLLATNVGPEGAKAAMTQARRAVDWANMTSEVVCTRIMAADGQPGVKDRIGDTEVWLHDAWPERGLPTEEPPGAFLGTCNGAVLRATRDGAVWIGAMSVRLCEGGRRLKLPAADALAHIHHPPPRPLASDSAPNGVRVERRGAISLIHFPFLNGAMSVARCAALHAAIRAETAGPAKAIVLTGGPEFWSNGIDLATIEAAASPPEESLATIEALNDVCLAILEATETWMVSAIRGNAGAGGVFMALAADDVVARSGVVLSPHYKNMGNLYGSEYWTYLLPRRLGPDGAAALMETRMPLLAETAAKIGLIDAALPVNRAEFVQHVLARVRAGLTSGDIETRLAAKAARRQRDEAEKPLSAYRSEELAAMRLNFFGFDTSYHVARLNFITGVPKSRTPLHLARHRQRRPQQTA